MNLKIIKKIAIFPFSFLFNTTLDMIIPKDKNLILYTGPRGDYSDNPRCLFEYGVKNERSFKHVFIVSSKQEYERVKKKFPNVTCDYAHSLKGKYSLFRAKTLVIGNELSNFSNEFLLKGRHLIVNLFHGIILKKIYATQNNFRLSFLIYFKLFKKKNSVLCVSSETEKKEYSRCFEMDPKDVYITGVPRNDVMHSKSRKLLSDLNLDHYDKFILYAPTFRAHKTYENSKGTVLFPFNDFDYKKLNDFLVKNNAALLIRRHMDDASSGSKNEKDLLKCKNIEFLTSERLKDVNPIFPLIDILITDYSGLYFDFLLLNRPLMFIPYDLEEYKSQVGLLYDYTKVTPGPKVYTFKSFMKHIDAYINNPSIDKEKREKLKRTFFKYDDANSSKRVFELIKKKLNHKN